MTTAAGRLGALAAVTPLAMYGAWLAIAGWGNSPSQLGIATAQIALGAVVAGWIVGGRVGRSLRSYIFGLVAYGLVGRLVLLPIDVVGSSWQDLQAGRVADLAGVVVSAGGYLAYGLVSSIYVSVYLLPFGAGWMATFILLRRLVER